MNRKRWLLVAGSFVFAIGISTVVVWRGWKHDGTAPALPWRVHVLAFLVFAFEVLEPGFNVGDVGVQFGQQHVLQRAHAPHRAPVFGQQARQRGRHGSQLGNARGDACIRCPARLGLGGRMHPRRRRSEFAQRLRFERHDAEQRAVLDAQPLMGRRRWDDL